MTLRRSAGCRRTSVSILLGAIIGLAACGQGTDTTGTGGDLVAPDSTVDSSASEDGDLDNGETDESEQDGESDAGTDTDTGSDTETGANTETGADPDSSVSTPCSSRSSRRRFRGHRSRYGSTDHIVRADADRRRTPVA
jgi:hypothetical protein